MKRAEVPSVNDVAWVQLQRISSKDADLYVFQTERSTLFTIGRVFTIHAHLRTDRGRHAHRRCSQVMVCLTGSCDVTADDGVQRKTFELRCPQDALYVPPSIWAAQSYSEPASILMVLCDQHYDEFDYIRDYNAFLAYRSDVISSL